MKHKPALYALLRLHAQLAGDVKAHKKEGHVLRMNLWHVGVVIQILEPGFNVKKIVPKAKRTASIWFERGECIQGTLDVLRKAETPLSARQIALVLLERKGINNPSEKVIEKTGRAVYAGLSFRRGKSVIAGDEMRPVRWSLR